MCALKGSLQGSIIHIYREVSSGHVIPPLWQFGRPVEKNLLTLL
jgi:hypothetical protein